MCGVSIGLKLGLIKLSEYIYAEADNNLRPNYES